MRRFVKPAVWTAVFVAAAGVGAYVAANTDPFPPGVDRPTGSTGADGSTGSTTPTPSPEAVVQLWTGRMRTAARHDLYVGGTCRSRWRTEVRLSIEPDGSATGTALARPVGDASCDFAQAQRQANRIRMSVRGRLTSAGVLALSFDHVTPVPAGSTDLGGFLTFLGLPRLALEVSEGGSAGLDLDERRDDGNRGTFVFDGGIRLRCLAGCQPVAET